MKLSFILLYFDAIWHVSLFLAALQRQPPFKSHPHLESSARQLSYCYQRSPHPSKASPRANSSFETSLPAVVSPHLPCTWELSRCLPWWKRSAELWGQCAPAWFIQTFADPGHTGLVKHHLRDHWGLLSRSPLLVQASSHLPFLSQSSPPAVPGNPTHGASS